MPKIEMGKQYKTRSGRPVRILCTDRNHPIYPVIALLPGIASESTQIYTKDGSWSFSGAENILDLIEDKPRIKREVWVNIYPTGAFAHPSKEIADGQYLAKDRIACVPITIDCEEGEGLE